jgi:hypothetical protein
MCSNARPTFRSRRASDQQVERDAFENVRKGAHSTIMCLVAADDKKGQLKRFVSTGKEAR